MKNNWKKELRNIFLCSCCSTDENELFDKFSDTSKSLKEMEKLIQNLLDKQIEKIEKMGEALEVGGVNNLDLAGNLRKIGYNQAIEEVLIKLKKL